jgi:F-type H+-transporting ATPase subunit b
MIELPDNNFLLPDATALIEVVVFLVVLVVVSKFVLPRLHSLMAQRRREIDEALDAAAETEAEARARHDDAARTLRSAMRQARLIIDRAYERHDHLVAEGMRKGREEYEWSTRKTTRADSTDGDPSSSEVTVV